MPWCSLRRYPEILIVRCSMWAIQGLIETCNARKAQLIQMCLPCNASLYEIAWILTKIKTVHITRMVYETRVPWDSGSRSRVQTCSRMYRLWRSHHRTHIVLSTTKSFYHFKLFLNVSEKSIWNLNFIKKFHKFIIYIQFCLWAKADNPRGEIC